jgi:ATP-binding cassette, subfamily B, bacterial
MSRPGGARGPSADSRITILVSHRFSTAGVDDLIVGFDGARVIEAGTHDALMARGGHYAGLGAIQATAYQ